MPRLPDAGGVQADENENPAPHDEEGAPPATVAPTATSPDTVDASSPAAGSKKPQRTAFLAFAGILLALIVWAAGVDSSNDVLFFLAALATIIAVALTILTIADRLDLSDLDRDELLDALFQALQACFERCKQ